MELALGSHSGAQPSWLERLVITGVRLLPGFGAMGSSDRTLRAVRGSAWTILGYSGTQALRLTLQVLLARAFLGPESFGLLALVAVFVSGLEMLSDLGIGTDVVRHPRGDESVFVNTAFLIQAARGIVLWLFAGLLAHPFAEWYKQPALFPMILVAATSVVFRGFASGSVWTMTRHVRVARLTALTLSSEGAGAAVTLVWAVLSPSPWALVAGRVAGSATYMLASHFAPEQPVSLQWDTAAAKELLLFGAGIFVSSATYFFSGEAERLFLGKFINVVELGCFSLASLIVSACYQAANQLVSQVFYPMIAASIRQSSEVANRHFKQTRLLFFCLSLFVGFVFVAYGPRLVSVFLPAKYAMTGWMLQWLGFRAAQQIYVAPASSIVLAFGDSKYPAIANITRFILMGSGLWLAFSQFGIHEALAVLAISSAAAYLVLFRSLLRHLGRAAWSDLGWFACFLALMALSAKVPLPGR